jgi:hypothetical protein
VTPPTPLPFPAPRVPAQPHSATDEEVELGESVCETSGLPNSHIFADAFRFLSESVGEANALTGPISQSILVSGSLPTPTMIPVPQDAHPPAPPLPPDSTATAEIPVPDPLAFPVLRQLELLHTQMIELIQQSQALMIERVVELPHRQVEELQAELTRLAELNTELGTLQESALKGTPARPPGAPTPLPKDLPMGVGEDESDTAAAIRDWVFERLTTIQKERHTRWGRVFSLVAGKGS